MLSPAEGMKDQYPNQNVRLVRSDQQYSLFNVRLHLGGGLGASIFQPETHDRVYLVVSCLLVPNQQVPPLATVNVNVNATATAVPGARASSAAPTNTSISASSYGPPTPITPMTVGIGAGPGPPTGGLPSFSSIAAGVDVPPPQPQPMRYPHAHAHAHAHSTTPYGSRPGTGPQQYTSSGSGSGPGYYPPRSLQQQQQLPPPPPPPPSSSSLPILPPVQTTPIMYPKSPSPPSGYRQQHLDNRDHHGNPTSSYSPYDYPPPTNLIPSQSQAYYFDEGYRQNSNPNLNPNTNSHPHSSHDEWADWRRRPDELDPSPSLSHELELGRKCRPRLLPFRSTTHGDPGRRDWGFGIRTRPRSRTRSKIRMRIKFLSFATTFVPIFQRSYVQSLGATSS